MSNGRYSFVALEEQQERPTVRAPAAAPNKQEVAHRIDEVNAQIASLQRRRAALLDLYAALEEDDQ